MELPMDLGHELIDTGLRLTIATLCGGVIGWNRERKHRPAGLRTLMLVSLGSAMFALLGTRVAGEEVGRVDPTRIVAGIVGGIGFLGAGSILQSKRSVHGVTTAAAIWATAGLGSACGLGYYPIAGFGTMLIMVVLWLAPVEHEFFGPKRGEEGHASKLEEQQINREARHPPP